MLIDSLAIIKNHFYFAWFALVLFVSGFLFSALVEHLKALDFLKILPKWFLKTTLKYISSDKNFWQVFLFIALFNSCAIFLYMLSGIFTIIPFIIAFATGMNIGIALQEPISDETGEKHPLAEARNRPGLISFLGAALVPILELGVFCFSMGFGMTMGLALMASYSPFKVAALVGPRIVAYFLIGVPVLIVSAALEAAAVKELQQ